MKHLKSLMMVGLALASVCLAPLVASAGDKGPAVYPETVALTNTLNNTTTVTANLGNAISLNAVESLGFAYTWQGSVAGNTNNITFTFARSIDNTNWETTPKLTWVIPMNGATTNTAYTNWGSAYIGPAAWIKILSAQNGDNACNATGGVFKVSKKLL